MIIEITSFRQIPFLAKSKEYAHVSTAELPIQASTSIK